MNNVAFNIDIPFEFVQKSFGLNYAEWQVVKFSILSEKTKTLSELVNMLRLTKRTIYQYRNNIKQKCGTRSLAFAGIMIVSTYFQARESVA